MAPEPPVLPAGTSWEDVWKELNESFKGMGAHIRTPGFYLWNTVLVAVMFFAAWGGLLLAPSWPVRILLAAITGFATVQAGLVGHDAGHRAVSKNQKVNVLVGHFFFSFITGYSFDRWSWAHNRHHARCNEGDVDPDMELGYLAVYAEDAKRKEGLARWTTRYQHLLLGLALLAQPYSMMADSISHLWKQPGRTHKDRLGLVAHIFLWGVLPIWILGFWPALINYVIRNAIAGPYMSAIFLFNHVGAPTVAVGQKLPYMYQQIITSRNIPQGWLTDWLTGGLNHQIEHHLFPTAPRPHYGRSRAMVRELCARYNIPYQEISYWRACWDVWNHFREMAHLAGRS